MKYFNITGISWKIFIPIWSYLSLLNTIVTVFFFFNKKYHTSRVCEVGVMTEGNICGTYKKTVIFVLIAKIFYELNFLDSHEIEIRKSWRLGRKTGAILHWFFCVGKSALLEILLPLFNKLKPIKTNINRFATLTLKDSYHWKR